MVMIPEPGGGLSMVKSYRPIVLSNCVAKLSEKVVAERVQCAGGLFHKLHVGGIKWPSAVDFTMAARGIISMNLTGSFTHTTIGEGHPLSSTIARERRF